MQRAATLFEPLGVDFRRRLSIGGIAESFGSTFLSSMSRNLDTLLSPGLSASLDQAPQVRSGSGAQTGSAKQMNHQGVQAKEHDEHNVGMTGDQRYALLLSIDLLPAIRGCSASFECRCVAAHCFVTEVSACILLLQNTARGGWRRAT